MRKDSITAAALAYSNKVFVCKASSRHVFALMMLFMFYFMAVKGQKSDYVWLQGYESSFGFDTAIGRYIGNTKFDFNYSPMLVSYDSVGMNFSKTNTSYCDNDGNLLFYTNGIYIANSLDEKIENSDSLNWGGLITVFDPSIYTGGYRTMQGIVTLQDPTATNQYYIVNTFGDTTASGLLELKKVVYHLLDLSANGGHGRVEKKNQTITIGELSVEIAAVRHANGRDWWMIVRQQKTNCYRRMLLSDKGIEVIQPDICLGLVFPDDDVGSFAVSPDGARIAHYCPRNGVQIFDFDRCEGLLSNVVTIPTPGLFDSGYYVGGACFSPSGRLLYIGATVYVFQYDTWAADIAGSVDTVAVYNGSQNPFGSYFLTMQMGPDGKIYESCGNSEWVYHVIERPDEKGDSCLFKQAGLELPSLSLGVPNFPNYRLGALTGSACDTLTDIRQQTTDNRERQIKVFPNPASDVIIVDYGFTDWSKGEVVLEISNELGQIVYAQRLPMYSGFQKIAVSRLAAGVYHVVLKRGNEIVANEKFRKQ